MDVRRISLLALLACPLVGCREPAGPANTGSRPETPPWFQDITEQSNLSFTHVTPPDNLYRVPDQMGSGGAFIDFNLDGRLDVFLIQNANHSKAPNQLFRQETDGRFVNVSRGSGLDIAGHGMGAAVGDVNNDGWPDLLVTEYDRIRLFLNLTNGTFTDITRQAQLDNPRWATSAAFFDYDRDGWLDLVVGNYLDYDPTQQCFDAGGAPEFCGPHGFPGLVTRLFHNLGRQPPQDQSQGPAARFEDVTIQAGLAHHPGPALGVVCADFDGDHWPDIFLADDGRPNRLFINQRNGGFREEAALRGVAFNSMGQTAGDMGIALGDVDGNGLFDLFITHLAEENHTLWSQNQRGLFQDQTAQAGLTRPDFHGTGFGVVLGDFNNNGDLDLALVNGLVKRGPTPNLPVHKGVDPFWIPYAQPNQLFHNNGQGQFTDISHSNPGFCQESLVGRGLIHGDIDNDGGLDLLVTSTGGPARLYRNIAPHRGHWLIVRAVDPAHGGRDAYGAEISVQAGNRRWWRLINPGLSYLGSGDPRAHIGLDAVSRIDSIQVRWPDGTLESFAEPGIDQVVQLAKGGGQSVPAP